MSGSDVTIVVIAKEPVAGKVKTRLTPAVTAAQAARLARAALLDTLEVVAAAPARRRILALDGAPGAWVPPQFEVVPQVGGGLDLRLAGAFAQTEGPTVLIGMDTPQIAPADLALDFSQHDAWLGPSPDGGYWMIGMRDPTPVVFPGVPMSTECTLPAQCQRLHAAGFRVGIRNTLRDVDTINDALVVAGEAPHTRFAMELERITSSPRWEESSGYDRALRHGTDLTLIDHAGLPTALQVRRWRSDPDEADASLLRRCEGATLDVGCGPGRLTVALTRQGTGSLGVDIAPTAVRLTRTHGGRGICRSVFARLPREGAWDTVLLADQNLGIGGDPDRLLGRAYELLRPGGTLLVEAHTADVDEVVLARLVDDVHGSSHPFRWAHVGPTAAGERAAAAGFRPRESWARSGRTFLAFGR